VKFATPGVCGADSFGRFKKGFNNYRVFKQVALKRRGRDVPSNMPSSVVLGTARGVQGEWMAKSNCNNFLCLLWTKR